MWLYNLHNLVTYGLYKEKVSDQIKLTAAQHSNISVPQFQTGSMAVVSDALSNITVNTTTIAALYDQPVEISKYLWPTVLHCDKCVVVSDYSTNHSVPLPPALTNKQIKLRKAEDLANNIQRNKIIKYLKSAYLIE